MSKSTSLRAEILKSKLPPTLPSKPKITQPLKRRKDYTPVAWHKYFEGEEDIRVGENVFRVYTSGKEGAVLLLLHGGGHSGLSWAVFTGVITKRCNCRVLAIDIRGHGHSKTSDDTNLAADVLAKDVADVVKEYFKNKQTPPIVMLGHSMGGAIAVHIAASNLIPTLAGLVVIDVVEGTALRALSAMDSFLKSRPQAFTSLEESIEWSIRSNQLRNLESAKVSIPGQLYRCSRSKVVTPQENETTNLTQESTISEAMKEEELGDEIVVKVQENSPSSSSTPENTKSDGDFVYSWRIDLTKTAKYWEGWFKNMSELFLSCSVPKLLLLAGIDRLDKNLTIGQMQGKFQMHVLPNCGHTVHEDAPDEVADVLMLFLQRNNIATYKAPDFQRPTASC